MSHTHEYRYWHAHMHAHADERSLVDTPLSTGSPRTHHDTGHFHLWAQTHGHGEKSDGSPHTHRDRQHHPEDDGVITHHHATADHKPLDCDKGE